MTLSWTLCSRVPHLKPLPVGQRLLHVHSKEDGSEGQHWPGNEHEYAMSL